MKKELSSLQGLLCRSSSCISSLFSIHQTLMLEKEGMNGLSSSHSPLLLFLWQSLSGSAVVKQTRFVFQPIATTTVEERGTHPVEPAAWLASVPPPISKHYLMMAVSQLETEKFQQWEWINKLFQNTVTLNEGNMNTRLLVWKISQRGRTQNINI